MKVSDFLSHGADNATTTRDLVRLTGIPERALRHAIQRERLDGSPILSNTLDGYYLPESNEEVAHCVRSLRHRAKEVLAIAAAIEKSAGVI